MKKNQSLWYEDSHNNKSTEKNGPEQTIVKNCDLYVQLLQTRKAFHQANSQIQLSNPRIDSQNLDTVQYSHQANSIQSLYQALDKLSSCLQMQMLQKFSVNEIEISSLDKRQNGAAT